MDEFDRFEAAQALQEWAIVNGYGMPLREAMDAIDHILGGREE